MGYNMLKGNKNSCKIGGNSKVYKSVPLQFRIFLPKRLVRKLGSADLSEFFIQKYLHIDVSSVKISFNLVERLARYGVPK